MDFCVKNVMLAARWRLTLCSLQQAVNYAIDLVELAIKLVPNCVISALNNIVSGSQRVGQGGCLLQPHAGEQIQFQNCLLERFIVPLCQPGLNVVKLLATEALNQKAVCIC